MRRTFRQLALLSCSGLGLAALAPAAHAAGAVTTLPANFVTTTSATLHGSIDTGGQTTSYKFEYGTSVPYQQATASQAIPPGQHQTYVVATIFQLRPNTTYHFRVSAVFFGIGGNYQEAKDGQDLTFTTKPTGRLALLSHRLRVAGGLAHVPLGCRSKIVCKGQFSITARAPASKTSAAATVVCATRPLRMRPGKTHTFTPRLRPACRALLHAKPNHVLRAHFTSTTSTGQRGANRTIKLIG